MRFKKLLPAIALTCLVPFGLIASSHREAPLIQEDPTVDNTDVYAFRSPDTPNTVTLIANFIPKQEPMGGPYFYNFSPTALYEIHIDNNGDAREDITYQFRFRTEQRGDSSLYNVGPISTLDDADWLYRQFYTVTRVVGDRRNGQSTVIASDVPVPPANIGPKSTPDYPALANAAIRNLANNGGRVFAGPRDDPFFIDLSVFDLLTLRPIQQLNMIPPVSPASAGVDGLRGYNVSTIAIQVPITAVTSNGGTPGGPTDSNAIIGVWSTSSRPRVTILTGGANARQTVSGFQQVSRLGHPLVNEVVVPTALKDFFNGLHPTGDGALLARVQDPELPKLIKAIYGVNVPPAPRNDLVQVFLTGIPGATMPAGVTPSEQLRLNLGVPVTAAPNRLGVIGGDLGGFPNGRRLVDDVVDIELRVLAGVLIPAFNVSPNKDLSDGVDANEKTFLSAFPYVAHPHQGYEAVTRKGQQTIAATP